MNCTLAKAIILAMAASPVFYAAPVVFYTDLASGPNTGGENGAGTILAICGENFGDTQGSSSVTIGGRPVTAYTMWGSTVGPCGARSPNNRIQSIAVSIGPAAATGAVVVTVDGVASNSNVTFTVRPGRIYCVSNAAIGGDTNNDGYFPSDNISPRISGKTRGCWEHGRYAKNKLQRGNILYLGSRSSDNFQSESGAESCGLVSGGGTWVIQPPCTQVGTTAQPIAIVGYPGAIATVGGLSTNDYGLSGIELSHLSMPGVAGAWTISNVTAIAGSPGGTPGNGSAIFAFGLAVRIVNCNLQAPFVYPGRGLGTDKTNATPGQTALWVYGNYVHNYKVGIAAPYNYWRNASGVYLGDDSNEVDFGWNEIDGSQQYSRDCLHIHSSPTNGSTDGYPMWGLHIHNNYIHDCQASGNDLNWVDPSKGSGIEFYNNIYARTGVSGVPGCNGWVGDQSGQLAQYWSNVADQNWAPMHGTIQVYNNTYYSSGGCGGRGAPGWTYFGAPQSGSSATVKPPASVRICTAPSPPATCSASQSGVLPPTTYTPYYAADSVGFDVTNGSSVVNQAVYDDGSGNLLENDATATPHQIGTINYATGAYTFTLLSVPPAGYSITYKTILGYKIHFTNNIVYQLDAKSQPYFGAGSSLLQQTHVTGSHNLFFTMGGQVVPSLFKANVGSNSDPQFISTATSNFQLQAGSIALAAGLGAFGFNTAVASSACDLNKDSLVNVVDIVSVVNQVLGSGPCTNGDVNKDGRCDTLDIQIINNAALGLGCNTGL